jgi:hypothetical protein
LGGGKEGAEVEEGEEAEEATKVDVVGSLVNLNCMNP